jgi:hypothetical protein
MHFTLLIYLYYIFIISFYSMLLELRKQNN